MNLTGYHQHAHFKVNELVLYFRMKPPDEAFDPCPFIEDLYCSRAKELAPNKCKNVRKCELLLNKDDLFTEYGIHGRNLMKLDEELRKDKKS
jgi:hypothetical protein